MLLQCRKTLGSLFALRTHTHNRCSALALKLAPLSQPPLFSSFTPLPELVIPRSLFFHFFIPPRYAQHQSLSESAISHLSVLFISNCHIIYHFFRLASRVQDTPSTEKNNIRKAFFGILSSTRTASFFINHHLSRLSLHDGNFR